MKNIKTANVVKAKSDAIKKAEAEAIKKAEKKAEKAIKKADTDKTDTDTKAIVKVA